VPIDLLDVDLPERPEPYRHGLLLSRPDRHVAWRGDALPRNPASLIAQVTGNAFCSSGIVPLRSEV
jgi:hypothetical protein